MASARVVHSSRGRLPALGKEVSRGPPKGRAGAQPAFLPAAVPACPAGAPVSSAVCRADYTGLEPPLQPGSRVALHWGLCSGRDGLLALPAFIPVGW